MTICILIIFKKSVCKKDRDWEFHGAEHKTIYAVDNDIPLIYEKVEKCPRVSNRCGTNQVVFAIFVFTVFNILAFVFSFFDYFSIRYTLPLFLVYVFSCIDNGDKKPILTLFYRISFWLQRKFLTKEPDILILSAAISAAQMLVDFNGAGKD